MIDFLRVPLLFSVAGAGVAVVVGVILAALRIGLRKEPVGSALAHSAAEALILASVVGILFVALRPNVVVDASLSLVPLSGLTAAQRSGSGLDLALVNLLGNLVVFIPLGVGLAWRSAAWSIWVLLGGMVALSLGVEAAQYLLGVGRASDVDDVLMNSIGGGLGLLIGSTCDAGFPLRSAGTQSRPAAWRAFDGAGEPVA